MTNPTNLKSNILNIVVYVLAITSIILSIKIWFSDTLVNDTLSSIGESYRIWYLFFSLALSFCFVLQSYQSIKLIKKKSTIILKKSWIVCYMVFCLLNIVLAILQAVIIDIRFQFEHTVLASVWLAHALVVIVFGMAVAFILTKEKTKKHILVCLFVFMMALGLINVYWMEMRGTLVAIWQILLIYSLIFAMFIKLWILTNINSD